MEQNRKFVSGVVPPKEKSEAAWWFAFQRDKLLVHPESSQAAIPCLADFIELGLPVLSQHYLGRLEAATVMQSRCLMESLLHRG